MKFTALCLALLGSSAQAFMPAQQASTSSALGMSDEKALFVPLAKVPCSGAAPLFGSEVFVGENYWDKLTMEYGTEDTGTWLRAA
jgi:hypothetical protein